MEFKDVIYNLRIERGMTQNQFAQLLGISSSSVNMWESGKRTPSTLMAVNIENILGLEPKSLQHYVDKDIICDKDGKQFLIETSEHIPVDYLIRELSALTKIYEHKKELSDEEAKIITAYRQQDKPLQDAIKRMLNV